MSTVTDQNVKTDSVRSINLLMRQTAANDDRLPYSRNTLRDTSISTGWNAYEVWRRLIKDVHDRRVAAGKLPKL